MAPTGPVPTFIYSPYAWRWLPVTARCPTPVPSSVRSPLCPPTPPHLPAAAPPSFRTRIPPLPCIARNIRLLATALSPASSPEQSAVPPTGSCSAAAGPVPHKGQANGQTRRSGLLRGRSPLPSPCHFLISIKTAAAPAWVAKTIGVPTAFCP